MKIITFVYIQRTQSDSDVCDVGVKLQYGYNSVPMCTHCMCDMFHPGLVSGLAVAGG